MLVLRIAAYQVGDQDGEQHHHGEGEGAHRDGDDQAGPAVVVRGLGLHGMAF
ncbi:hypothetical protein ACIQNT_38735 [Streptomyces luteogriseus]|uniref:hypothetical protein n=1 Tax=Streptomyces luteogriseus TaxID=68233 RepID=UPI0037F14B70